MWVANSCSPRSASESGQYTSSPFGHPGFGNRQSSGCPWRQRSCESRPFPSGRTMETLQRNRFRMQCLYQERNTPIREEPGLMVGPHVPKNRVHGRAYILNSRVSISLIRFLSRQVVLPNSPIVDLSFPTNFRSVQSRLCLI